MNFATDIDPAIARAAHYGTSFVPDRRADQERDGYAQTLQHDYDSLAKLCDTPAKLATLAAEFARYREGYKRRKTAQLLARGRCMSTMITGGSNFNVRRNEKRNETERRRADELSEFRERALKAIRRELCPELRPIMAGDGDAADRLRAKIEEAQKLQDQMTEANKIVRRSPKNLATPEKTAALLAIGCSERVARELFVADFCGRFGFPGYELTNNNANIRRMKERLEVIARNQAAPATETAGADGVTIEDNPAENRIRLFFPGKPAEAIREDLKRNGFRWTPSLGCWQAYRNWRAMETAKKFAAQPAAEATP